MPGLLGSAAFLGRYMTLDYSQAAQRDGDGALLAIVGLLILQGWPGRWGRLASALALAAGASIRPQVVLLVLAYWMALAEPLPGGPAARRWGTWLGWNLMVGAAVAATFLPLIFSGIMGDFLRGVRQVAYGSTYNQASLKAIPVRLARQLVAQRDLWPAPLAALICRQALRPADRPLARTWVIALLGLFLYAPLSPVFLPYLFQPMIFVWAVSVAILAQVILAAPSLTGPWRLALALLLAG